MSGFIDLHFHLLWGMDDGPQTQEGTWALLRAAQADGIRVIAATTHVMAGLMPFDKALYLERLECAREYCRVQGINIKLITGAEARYMPMLTQKLDEGAIPTLGGTRYVLVELSDQAHWSLVEEAALSLLRSGYTPVFAHIERYACFLMNPWYAVRLRRHLDIRYQVDASSIINRRGVLAPLLILKLIKADALDLVASDAHSAKRRPPHMQTAYKALCRRFGHEVADKVTQFDLSE